MKNNLLALLGAIVGGVGHVLGFFSLATGILLTAAALEHCDFWLTLLGVGLVVGGVVGLELAPGTRENAGGGNDQPVGKALFDHGPTVFELLILQAIIILIFALLLDGGVRLRACLYCYLPYVPGAVILLVRRSRALTKVDIVYLKWGWVPIITVGVPLLVRLSKGLI